MSAESGRWHPSGYRFAPVDDVPSAAGGDGIRLVHVTSQRELDAIASVVDPAWNEVLPTTYLLGRDGKVARRVQGAKTHEEFRALIEAVLAAGARAG